MHAGRLGADEQRPADLAVGPTLGEQPEHLRLAGRQGRGRDAGRLPGCQVVDRGQQRCRTEPLRAVRGPRRRRRRRRRRSRRGAPPPGGCGRERPRRPRRAPRTGRPPDGWRRRARASGTSSPASQCARCCSAEARASHARPSTVGGRRRAPPTSRAGARTGSRRRDHRPPPRRPPPRGQPVDVVEEHGPARGWLARRAVPRCPTASAARRTSAATRPTPHSSRRKPTTSACRASIASTSPSRPRTSIAVAPDWTAMRPSSDHHGRVPARSCSAVTPPRAGEHAVRGRVDGRGGRRRHPDVGRVVGEAQREVPLAHLVRGRHRHRPGVDPEDRPLEPRAPAPRPGCARSAASAATWSPWR